MNRTARVELVDDLGLVDFCEGPAPALLPPRHLRIVEASDPGLTKVRLRYEGRRIGQRSDDDEPLPDVVVGSFPVLFGRAGRDLRVQRLHARTPMPFDDQAIGRMWHAANELPGAIPASVRLQGDWEATVRRTSSDHAVDLPSLPRLAAAAHDLLMRWPAVQQSELFWRPLELAGGRERPVETLRSSHARLADVGGAPTPQYTARLRSVEVPWQLRTVSVVTHEVARRIRAMQGFTLPELDLVSQRAMPLKGVVDPALATWPRRMREVLDAALDVLAEIEAVAAGGALAPLCDLWRLYEAWVGWRVIEDLRKRLGPPTRGPLCPEEKAGKATVLARWEVDGTVTEVWLQKEVGSSAAIILDGAIEFTSVTALLRPDVLVAHRDSAGGVRLTAYDAKHRGHVRMRRGAAGEAASKYLWGLRSADEGRSPMVDKMVLVTSAGAEDMFHPASLIDSVLERPPRDGENLPASDLGAFAMPAP